jgi:hypothetical protein
MADSGQHIAARRIVSVDDAQWSQIVRSKLFCERKRWTGSAMTDFLKGASWGAWFVLAAIIAAGLWAFVY